MQRIAYQDHASFFNSLGEDLGVPYGLDDEKVRQDRVPSLEFMEDFFRHNDRPEQGGQNALLGHRNQGGKGRGVADHDHDASPAMV